MCSVWGKLKRVAKTERDDKRTKLYENQAASKVSPRSASLPSTRVFKKRVERNRHGVRSVPEGIL